MPWYNGIIEKVKGAWNRMFGIQSAIKDIAGISTAISAPMDAAIRTWLAMYTGNEPWKSEHNATLRLASFVASEVARAVTIEMKVNIINESSPRAVYLNEQFQKVVDSARIFTEYAAAGGTVILKPYVDSNDIGVDFVQADAFIPTSFSVSGGIIGCVFINQIVKDGIYYTRLESHQPDGDDDYIITNKAYKSTAPGLADLGREITLTEVPEWADIEPIARLENTGGALFAVFKMPLANTVDMSSPMGVSVYARAVDLIKDADEQYTRLIWEMESGKRALFVGESALEKKDDGTLKIPDTRFYRTLKSGSSAPDKPVLFEEWSPGLRVNEQQDALQSILSAIEDACGLSRGTLSKAPESGAGGSKTATELKIMRQRTYALVNDTQKSLENAFEELARAMNFWASASTPPLAPDGDYEISVEWDDSIIVDRSAEFAERMQLMAIGAMRKEAFLAWYLNISEEQALKELPQTEAPDPAQFDEKNGEE